MKARWIWTLVTASLLVLAAWVVRTPDAAQANEVPEKYRDTVRKGLDYLAAKQHKDGHWEGDEGKHPVAMTAFVGLALFMDAATPTYARSRKGLTGTYTERINKAADWLIEKSNAAGLIFSGHDSEVSRYMEGHGLATLFLAGVYGEESDSPRRKKLHEVLTRAVKYIVRSQSNLGGWYHTSKLEGHDLDVISATAIQLQALVAADKAGIAVPQAAIHDAEAYLMNSLNSLKKLQEDPKAPHNCAALTAASLGVLFDRVERMETQRELQVALLQAGELQLEDRRKLQSYLRKNDMKTYLQRLEYCQAELPADRACESGRDDLARYYLSQALVRKGESWGVYETKLFDHLQKKQSKDGSWPAPPFAEGIGVGPVYSAALWCTVLQLDRRCYPSMIWPVLQTR